MRKHAKKDILHRKEQFLHLDPDPATQFNKVQDPKPRCQRWSTVYKIFVIQVLASI